MPRIGSFSREGFRDRAPARTHQVRRAPADYLGVSRREERFGEAFEALLLAARAGAPWAWERLYLWLSPVVAGYLRVQGAAEVDDLTSEVFVGVLRGIGEFHGTEDQFRGWVFVIAHRRLQDERRRLGRREPAVEIEEGDGPAARDAEDEALRQMAVARVEAVCSRLAPDQRDVVLLRMVGDLSPAQVAAVLGKSEGAVRALQRRGFDAVRKIFLAEGVQL